jgi:hypothetical protein
MQFLRSLVGRLWQQRTAPKWVAEPLCKFNSRNQSMIWVGNVYPIKRFVCWGDEMGMK